MREALDDSVLEIWLGRPFTIVIALLAVAGVMLAIRWQKDEVERFEPWALIAVGLAVLGFGASFAGATYMAAHAPWHGLEAQPIGVFRIGEAFFVAAVVAGLIALALLHVKHLRRKGRILATCAVACSASYGWIVHYFLVDAWSPAWWSSEIELVQVEGVSPLYWGQGESAQEEHLAQLGAQGALELDGVPVAATELGARLADIARQMPQEDGVPDGSLQVLVDRRAPFGSLATLATGCASPEVRIWKLYLLVEGRGAANRTSPSRAMFLLLFQPSPGAPYDERIAAWPAERRVDVSSNEAGRLRITLGGESGLDIEGLEERLRRAGLESSEDALLLRAPADMSWGSVAPVAEALGQHGTWAGVAVLEAD